MYKVIKLAAMGWFFKIMLYIILIIQQLLSPEQIVGRLQEFTF